MGYSNLFLHNVLNFTVKLFLILKIKKSLVSWGEKNWRTFFCFSVFYDHKKDQPHDSFRKSHKSVLSDIFHLVTEQRLQKFSLCKHTHPGKFTYQRCFVRDNSHRGQTQSIAKLCPCSLHYPQPNGQIRALLQVPLVRRLIAAEAAIRCYLCRGELGSLTVLWWKWRVRRKSQNKNVRLARQCPTSDMFTQGKASISYTPLCD